MRGMLYILLSYLLGDILSRLTGRMIPASVYGMLVLFITLRLRLIRIGEVRMPARMMLSHMTLFFIPIGVGIMTTYKILEGHITGILIAVIVSTVLTLGTVGILQQTIGRKR